MQACKKCGTDNQEGVVFCGGCGAKFVPKKKIPVQYIAGAVVILLVGAIALHFMFDSQSNQSPQTAVVSAPKAKASAAVARKVAVPAPQPTAQSSACPNIIQAADYLGGITLSYAGRPCVEFTLNAGQTSPWITTPLGSRYVSSSPNKKPICAIYPSGATFCAGKNETNNLGTVGNVLSIQASQDGTDVLVTLQ